MVVAAAFAALVAAVLASRIEPHAWEQQRWAFLGHRALDGLLDHADLPIEVDTVEQRMPLALQGMKLSAAETAGLRTAMVRHRGVNDAPQSRYRLLASAHQWGSIYAVEFRLVRRGWALRVQELERMLHVPWVPAAGLLLGGLLCWFGLPQWFILPIAAASSQACLAWLRRGEPYREIPVHWREWPDKLYERLDRAWTQLVLHRVDMSALVALGLVAVAWWLSRRAQQRGASRSPRQIAGLVVWFVASVIWWDACFRTSLPLRELQVDGSGLMRVSHALRALGWACSGLLLLRRSAEHPVSDYL